MGLGDIFEYGAIDDIFGAANRFDIKCPLSGFGTHILLSRKFIP
jgi:hypothetical protein